MSMAQGIQKRISKKNVVSYRVQIRESDGFPPKSQTFPTLQEAKDWQKQEKARRRQGYGPTDQIQGKQTLTNLEEFLRLFEECKNSRNEHLLPVVVLAITTGMRRGEILGLTWDCVDFEKQTILLRETKNGKQRTVSIVGEALELLRIHHQNKNPNTPYVFPAKKRIRKK